MNFRAILFPALLAVMVSAGASRAASCAPLSPLSPLSAESVKTDTAKSLAAGFNVQCEYNKTFRQCWTFDAHGNFRVNSWLSAGGGIALWKARRVSELDFFLNACAAIPVKAPFFVSLSWQFNDMIEYDIASHTLLPLAEFLFRYAGILLGPGMRFTSFFGESPVFESFLSFRLYVNVINNPYLRLGFSCSNFDKYNSGNFGSYFFSIEGDVALGKIISLVSRIELYQSGSAGLSADFYGAALKLGLEFSW